MSHLALLRLEARSHSNPQLSEQRLDNVSLFTCSKSELSTILHRMKFRCHVYCVPSLLSPEEAHQHCSSTLFSRSSLTNFKTHDTTSKTKQLLANSDSLSEALCSCQHFPSPALDHLPGRLLCFF